MRRVWILGLALALLGGAVDAGDDRVVVVKAKRIVTAAGDPIDDGVIVMKDGRIDAIGPAADVEVPSGARIVEVDDGVVYPGIVNPYSRLGTFSRARSFRVGSGFKNKSDTVPTTELFRRQPVFDEILEAGVTTYGLVPGSGGGFSGLLSVIRPHGAKAADMVVRERVLLRLAFPGGDSARSGLKNLLSRAKSERKKIDDAKKRRAEWEKREARKREAEKKKKAKEKKKDDGKDKKDKTVADEKKKKKSGPKVPEMKANIEWIAAAREKKMRVLLEIDQPKAMLHFEDVLGDDHELDAILVTSGRGAIGMKDRIVERGYPVLLTPSLTTMRDSRELRNPAAELAAAGVEIAFRPGADSVGAMRGMFFNLAGLIRTGLDRDVAIRAITAVPAKWLGVADSVGTLEKGKRGDLLVFSRDPLSTPLAELRFVVLGGSVVHEAHCHGEDGDHDDDHDEPDHGHGADERSGQ